MWVCPPISPAHPGQTQIEFMDFCVYGYLWDYINMEAGVTRGTKDQAEGSPEGSLEGSNSLTCRVTP